MTIAKLVACAAIAVVGGVVPAFTHGAPVSAASDVIPDHSGSVSQPFASSGAPIEKPCVAGENGSLNWVPAPIDAGTRTALIRDLGPPGRNVHVTRAEVVFRWWPAVCGGPECETTFPEKLRAMRDTRRKSLNDPLLVERLWKDYGTIRASGERPYNGCVDDARIMVRFCTSEPAERWLAAGASCDVLMVTEDRRLHERNGPVLRDMADAIGVTAQMEAAVPDIFR